MKNVAIIQARYGSTRLPGKVLKPVAGRPMLHWMLEGMVATPGLDSVVVAAPEGNDNDPVEACAKDFGIETVRGSEHDVLDRFRTAAEATGADVIMRVTSDCPMTDPGINGEVLALLSGHEDVDYACNNEPFAFAHGLDCEVVRRAALERAAAEASDDYDREHVTPYVKRAPGFERRYLVGPGDETATWRLTVDTPEDFAFFEQIVERLGDGIHDFSQVRSLLEREPELHDINRASRQR